VKHNAIADILTTCVYITSGFVLYVYNAIADILTTCVYITSGFVLYVYNAIADILTTCVYKALFFDRRAFHVGHNWNANRSTWNGRRSTWNAPDRNGRVQTAQE
jgi:hypothetical protein